MSLVTTTPQTHITNTSVVSTPSPGTWRHPRFGEIAQRKNAATFNDRNIRKIFWNGGALLLLWVADRLIASYPDFSIVFIPPILQTCNKTILLLVRLIFIFNIAVSLYPLVKPKDDVTDIPLTPSQRALLGLDPFAGPSDSPVNQCITPPRYPRSLTPRSGSPASRGSNSTRSPLSRNGSPLFGPDGSESPFSASASSLWQKSVGGSRDSLRRNSFGSSSPRSIVPHGKDATVLSTSNSPSPLAGKGVSVGLNNRWLYERGRVTPGSRGPKIYS